MNQSELLQRKLRVQRKLAASYKGWHSGRVDQLEEALRGIQRELDCNLNPELRADKSAFPIDVLGLLQLSQADHFRMPSDPVVG